jgi:hypothetical protein
MSDYYGSVDDNEVQNILNTLNNISSEEDNLLKLKGKMEAIHSLTAENSRNEAFIATLRSRIEELELDLEFYKTSSEEKEIECIENLESKHKDDVDKYEKLQQENHVLIIELSSETSRYIYIYINNIQYLYINNIFNYI